MTTHSDSPISKNWCGRDIHVLRPYYCLVTTEDMYYEECKNIGANRMAAGTWLSGENSHATITYLQSSQGKDVAIVAFPIDSTRTGIQIAGLLVHEATHIWQHHCELIGERRPSSEFEAYAIQWISQELMEQYADQAGLR